MTNGFGDSPKRWRLPDRHGDVVIAGALTIVVASLLAPVLGAFIDYAVNNSELATSFVLREFSNLLAAVAGVIALLVTANRLHEPAYTWRPLVLLSSVSVAAYASTRLVAQYYVDLLDLPSHPKWVGAEVLWALLLWPLLTIIMALVAQREQREDAQMVLLDEARRALNDDQEALRSRVFDHLHGTVSSELIVARVRLNDAASEIADDGVAQRIRSVADNLQRLHELEVRRLAHLIVATGLDVGLDEALAQLAASCAGLCEVTVQLDPAYAELDAAADEDAKAGLRLTVYRIIEECISNALRHAHAEHVDVRIDTTGDGPTRDVRITVSSDGDLPTGAVSPGVGLRVIRARIAPFNGTVETDTVNGRFVVRIGMRVTV